MRLCGIVLAGLLGTVAPWVRAQPPAAGDSRETDEFMIPADAGIVNVKTDFGAKGDGVSDDTEALRKAIAAGMEKSSRYTSPAFVYLPKGTYLISDTLWSRISETGWSAGWRAGMLLVGESRKQSIIRLKDHLPAYADPKAPRPVIATGSESDGDKNVAGGGNRAFRHSVINLTVDCGQNPGAVGIDYVANNRGTIENVTIIGDKGGYCGLLLERWWPGPALVKNLEIAGFDYGIRCGHFQYSMTFEHLKLRGQKKVGIVNDNNILSIRGLTSDNKVPVIQCTGEHSMVVLLDGTLLGGASDTAISSKGKLTIRNLIYSGYARAIENGAEQAKAVNAGGKLKVSEFYTDRASLSDPAPPALNLPVEETPVYSDNNLDHWANVVTFGATPNKKGNDDADGIQKAIDSGKPVVYLPNGNYDIRKTIIVRGAVRKIIGMQSSITPVRTANLTELIRVEGTGALPVVLEHLSIEGMAVQASSRPVAFRHCDLAGGYRNTETGTGTVFFEDIMGRPILIQHPQKVFGRQVNSEFGDQPLVENHGGTLWILGFKSEGEMTCILTQSGRTELLGALLYPLKGPNPKTACFIVDGGQVSLTYGMNGGDYPLHVKQKQGNDWAEAGRQTMRGRGPALYTGMSK